MSQNNPASWTNNEWKFSYEIPEQESGLPGQLSPVGDRQQSPLDMLGAFGEALFSGIFDTLGNIFNGVIEVGGAIAGGLIEGIKGLVGWVGSTIASLFSGGEPRVPPPPIYSEISTDLEGDIKPFVDAFKESQEKAFQAVADAKALRELFDENQKIVSDRIDEADDKIQQVGDVDAKISAEAARILAEVEIHKAATEEALGKAETVREDLAAYKLAADAQIQSALADAKTGLDKLDALEPRVSGVISDLEAYELAVDAQIQDLLGKASGAITDAGQALTQYDDLLSEYEGFKTEASGSLEALRKSSTTQGQKLGVIEDDMPGIKTSITNVFALAETAQSTVDNLQIGGRNLLLGSAMPDRNGISPGITSEMTPEGLKIVVEPESGNYVSFLRRVVGPSPAADTLKDGDKVTFSIEIKSEDSTHIPSFFAKDYMGYMAMKGAVGPEFTTVSATRTWVEKGEWRLHLGFEGRPGTYIIRNFKLERGDKATDWTPAPEDVAADIATAQAKADKAEQDAEKKADDARIAAELYAKEKSEADVALAEERAAAEAARVAKEAADAAKAAAATDATNKANEAERLAKIHADTQADAAQEAAEATAALDATTKANKAKADAEKEAKRLSDIAAAAAATAQTTANQAKADAESKSKAAREAAEKYAKEKSEADAAQALVDATAEAARVAQEAAAQAVLDSASDADSKVALAEAALKTYAEAQAAAAQEAAEATAALDATTKANKAKTDAEANAKKLSDAAAASAATAQRTADQAKLDATNKAAAAQTAAQNYAKEKAEAERAIAEENAAAEALRVAQLEADAAKTAAAADAKTKADEAERLAKIHADAQAALAKEQAEATAALDATTKANKAKADAEANAKKLSDKAQKLAEEVKFTADTTAGKIPGMQDAITTAHGKAEEAQRNLDNLEIGGRNLLLGSAMPNRNGISPGITSEMTPEGLKIVAEPVNENYVAFSQSVMGFSSAGDTLKEGDQVTFSFEIKSEDSTRVPSFYAKSSMGYMAMKGAVGPEFTTVSATRAWVERLQWHLHLGFSNRPGTYIVRNFKLERGNRPTDWTPAPEDTEAEIAASVQASADALNTYRTSNDKAVSDANDAAAAAAGVAKGKGEVIYQSTAPTGARATKANLWIRTSDNKPHTYDGSKWVEVTDKVATDAADKAATALSTAQEKTTTYYGSSAPSGTKTVGDLWLDSGSDNALKRWSGSAWVAVRDGQLAKALKAAGDAQSTADGKVRSFARSTAPTGMTATDVGDIWLDTDDGNKMYRWSGTSWVTMQDHLAVQAKEVADTATTKADTAQSTVDNLQVGGRNLLLDSHFDKGGFNGWSSIYGSQAVADSKYVKTFTSDVAASRLEKNFTLNETGIFTFTIYMKSDAGIRWQGFVGLTVLGVEPSDVFWHEGGFHAYSVTFRNDEPGAKTIRAYTVNQKNGDVYTIDWEKLERGNKATDWSPAPEDVDKSIADVDYKASETGKLIPGMQDSLNTAHSKAETAQSTVDNLQIGGRNLLRNSKLDLRNSKYQIARVDLAAGHGLQADETVTISVKAQLGEGVTSFTVHNSQTNSPWLRIPATDQDADGVYRVTAPFRTHEVNTHLLLYTIPSTATAESSIEWIKLERGNKATDWSPAPEDVDKSIADVDYKASETGKLIPGMQDSLNTAHSKAETAQSTVDNLQIGGRNLLQRSGGSYLSTWNTTYNATVVTEDGKQALAWNSSGNIIYFGRRGAPTIHVGEWVTFSFLAKATKPMSLGRVYVSGGASNTHLRNQTVTTEWERYSLSYQATADFNPDFHMYPGISNGDGTYETFFLADLKLEYGNKATDWTPAPEDVEAEIQAQANALAGYQLSNDKAVDAAKKSAQDAAGLAGGKGEVIYSTTTPPTAKRSAANLWIKGPKNTPHVWNGSAWVEITDQAAKDAAKAAADANTLAETKTTTYYQTSAPSVTKTVGDLWIDQSTAGKNTLKRWSGSAWVVVQDKAIAEAMVAAGTAQSTADEKVRTFARTTAPTGMKSEHVGDLWIDTDDGNKLWRWSGTAWVGVQDAAIAAAQKAAEDAAKADKIHDTRSDNEPPSYYWENYSQRTVREFKFLATVDAGTTGYGTMTTMVPWTDHSGGSITQEFSINNSDTVLYRRSAGSKATATWTAWKDRAKDLADSITSLGNDLASKTGPSSTLQKNINSLEKATDDQYKKLNNDLWGDQGELNKLNSLLWDDQGRLNQATEIFKSNITGWKKDVYNAFIDFDKTNKYQDGLVAANNRAIKANTEAVSAHQRILQVAYPDSGSAIPMVPGGVNVGTEDAPKYEAMPEWLKAYGVTNVTGRPEMEDKRAAHSTTRRTVGVTDSTKVKANPTALYRYSFWIQASATGSEMFIRLYDQNGAGAVLENTPDAGVPTPRTSSGHMYWFNGNVPTVWTKISGVIRLNPDVTHVYIAGIGLNYQGTVASQWLTDIQLEPIIPSQTDVNKALSEVNDAQTAILSSQQDVLDMAFPNTNLVPMTNGVPAWTSTVSANPIRTPEGNWRFTSATAIQPGTGSKHMPTVNEVVYRAMVRARRTGSDGTFSMRLRKAGTTTNVSLAAVTGKPAPAGASRVNFLTASQTAGTDWTTWYYDFTLANNTGDVRIGYVIGSIGVEVSQLSVVALLPSQMEVDAVQDEAAESNRKAIDALERTVRLSFPHINTLPYSGGNPLWQSRASWITRTTAAANLPPMGQRTEPFSSLINGDGTMTRNAASSVAIPDDVSELRIRGLLRSNGGFFPIVDLHNDAGASIISAWRRTFPTDDEVSLSGRSEIWYSASSAGGYTVDGNNTDPWQPFDIIVQVKPGSKNFHIKLSSTSLIAIHGLAVFSYYPSQSEVDFAQDRAMRALSGSVDLATSIGTAAATAAENLGAAQTAMQMSLVTTASYIPRVMIINDLGHRSAHERSEHVQVRKDGSSSFLIDARGSSWTGLIVVTTFYGSSLVTDTFEITPGGNRTNGVLKRRSNSEAQHMRIDYWVNPAVETKEVVLGGTDIPHDRWTELAGTSFTATGFVPEQGAALPVLHIAELTVGWDRATHHAKYGVQIKLDGIVVSTLEETKVGPRYPWGQPYAKQVISWSGQVMPNQKITFEVLSNDTVPSQRRLRDATRLVSYTKEV